MLFRSWANVALRTVDIVIELWLVEPTHRALERASGELGQSWLFVDLSALIVFGAGAFVVASDPRLSAGWGGTLTDHGTLAMAGAFLASTVIAGALDLTLNFTWYFRSPAE